MLCVSQASATAREINSASKRLVYRATSCKISRNGSVSRPVLSGRSNSSSAIDANNSAPKILCWRDTYEGPLNSKTSAGSKISSIAAAVVSENGLTGISSAVSSCAVSRLA